MNTELAIEEKRKISLVNIIIFILFVITVLIGLGSTAYIMINGHQVLALNNMVPWNIFVSAYMFFGLSASGICMLNSFSHVFGIKNYQIIDQRATILALILLGTGVFSMAMHLGRPWQLYYILLSPNFTAPVFWLIIVYTVYMAFLLIKLYLIYSNKSGALKIVSRLILLYSICATGILGAFFGILYARPFWYGGITLAYVLLSAFLSGLAFFLVATVFGYRISGTEMSDKMKILLHKVGKIMALAAGSVLFVLIGRMVTGVVSGEPDYSIFLSGQFGLHFWILEVLVGLVLPIIIMIRNGVRRLTGPILASVLVLVGIFVARYTMVIGGQLIQPLGVSMSFSSSIRLIEGVPHALYSPNAIEILFVLGLFGFVGFFYMVVNYLFGFFDEN